MTLRRLAASCGVLLCCISIALLASARNRSGIPTGGSDVEILLGHYQCYVDPETGTGWESAYFDASGDVLLDDTHLLGWSVDSQLPAGEHCAAR